MRRLTAWLAALVLVAPPAALAACGGDDSEDGDGENTPVVFPDGGSVPEESATGLTEAARGAGCELKDTGSAEGGDLHVAPSEDVTYPDNPPTLGKHWPPGYQAQDGLYQQTAADEALVHTMEHGRVIIWAKPSLPRDARATLRALFEEDDYQLVLTPRANMPYAVAATAWNGEPGPAGTGRTLGCPDWSEEVVDAIRAFRDEHRSRGPEAVP